jgi:sarcosine oxidase
MRHFDVIVVGLGAAGSATVYQLARRGVRVLGIDRFSPPHDQGSSHGETRITRLAIGEDAALAPLVLRSHQIWRDLEAVSGERLYCATGGIVVADPTQGGVMHHRNDFLGATIAAAQQYGIDHEVMDAGQAAQRFNDFLFRGHEQVYFEPEAGYLVPEVCVRVQLTQATALGAQIRTGRTVQALLPNPGGRGVRVRTNDGEFAANQVVVCAGPWATQFLPAAFGRCFRVLRQVLYWFELAPSPADTMAQRPVFIWQFGTGMDDIFYGFPPLPGHSEMKVGTEQYQVECSPDAVDRNVSMADVAAIQARYVAPHLRHARSRCTRTATCLYTVSEWSRFVVAPHPELPQVTIVSPCSGHGFKHSAAIGEVIAARLVGAPSQIDNGSLFAALG